MWFINRFSNKGIWNIIFCHGIYVKANGTMYIARPSKISHVSTDKRSVYTSFIYILSEREGYGKH